VPALEFRLRVLDAEEAARVGKPIEVGLSFRGVTEAQWVTARAYLTALLGWIEANPMQKFGSAGGEDGKVLGEKEADKPMSDEERAKLRDELADQPE
jgi:hypothetical protein